MSTPPNEALPLWEVLPGPRPEVPAYRVALALRPGAEPARYAVQSSWAEAGAGPTRRTRLERAVDLRVAARPGGQLLTLRTTAPRLKQPARTAFDDMALLLADLYAELVFDLAPTGELRGLANGAAIGQQWAHVRQALARQYPTDSEVVAALVAGVSRQLARPAGLWPSLPYDYLYAALPGSFYQQPFETTCRYVRPRVFPQFFDGLALHFTETLRLAAPAAPGPVELAVTGTIDPVATDVAAVAARIRAALGPGPAVAPEDVRFAYAATHCFARDTDLPTHVRLTVSCAYQEVFYKEYHLVVQALPPTNLLPL